MATPSIFLILLSAVLHVGWNFLTKKSRYPKAFSATKGLVILSIAAVVLSSIPSPEISIEGWLLILVSGIVHALYALSLATAYEAGDISFVYPISRSAPAFVPIGGYFFLDEKLSLQAGIGIALVVLCVFLLQFTLENRTKFSTFFRFIKTAQSRWAFITLACVVVYSIVDKAGMEVISTMNSIPKAVRGLTFFVLENTLCFTLLWTYMIVKRIDGVLYIIKKEWLPVILAGLGTTASYSIVLHVMQTETVSSIVTLRQSSIILAVFVGWWVSKESQAVARLLLSILLVFGLVLVATSN